MSVRWLFKLPREAAVLKSRFRRPTFQAIKQPELIAELLAAFKAASPAR